MAKKNQLNEMISLINRMENPQTGWHAILNESIEEYKDTTGLGRREFTDFDDFMANIQPVNNWFVGIGWIQNYPVKNVYPDKPDNGVTTRDTLTQYQQGLGPDSRLSGKLSGMLQSPEMATPTGRAANFKSLGQSFRSMKEGNPFTAILKVTTYNFPWKVYSEAYGAKMDKIMAARSKAGFGYPEGTYDDNDWRRNPDFRGLGARPFYEPKLNPDGSEVQSPYSLVGNSSFNVYKDNDEFGNERSDKRVMKALIPVGNGKSIFCAIDGNGEIDDISNNIYKILGGPQSSMSAAKITDEMSDDEKQFRQEIASIENASYNPQWFTTNIAYMVGVGKDVNTGENTPYRFINKNIVLQHQVEINPQELSDVIEKCSERAYRDVMAKQKASDNEMYNDAME